MSDPRRWTLLLAVALMTAYGSHVALHAAPAAASCNPRQCKTTPTPTRTATSVPTRTPSATPTATASPSPTATFTPSPTATVTPSPTATSTATPSATPTSTATLLSTSMTPWYVGDSTGNVSTVNATMTWDGDTNQSGPLPTGTLTATVYDASCPTTGCIYTHTITSADYQWAYTGTWSWSIHYAFALGTEYPPTDSFWVSYSGDGTFTGSSAQALNT